MTSFALNNLWTYLQGLSLSQDDREWLANKLIMPKEKTATLSAEERKAEFLKLAGIWSETEEGEEYYQMMKHRNDGRPLNREINLDDLTVVTHNTKHFSQIPGIQCVDWVE